MSILLGTQDKTPKIDGSSSEFKNLLIAVVKKLKSLQIVRRPYDNPSLPLFSGLNKNERVNAVAHIKFYLNILSAEEQTLLPNNASALWRWFKQHKIILPANFFSFLSHHDCIELYDVNNIQAWRNINMMKAMTYTMEQIFTVPWYLRYDRDEVASTKCLAALELVKKSTDFKVHSINIKNFLVEKQSDELLELDVLHKYISPIKDQQRQFAGYLVVSSVDVVGSKIKSFEAQP